MEAGKPSASGLPQLRPLFIVTIVAAAILRFAALDRQPLWLDEATDASFAQRSLHDCVFAEIVHPPLYRTLLHLMVSHVGNSGFVLRLLPALFGVLTVAAIVLLARRLRPQAGIAAGVLAATSPFLIFYSQENRDYSLLVLLTVLATVVYYRFRQNGTGIWLYALLSAFLLYTHYVAIFVLIAHEWIYWRFWRRNITAWLLARAAAAAAFAPWCWWVARHYWPESRLFISPASLIPSALLRFFLGYGVAAADAARQAQSISAKLLEETPVVLPSMALFLWLVYLGVRSITARETRHLLAAVILFPWVTLLLLAPWLQLAHERYLVFQAPFLLFLAAAGIGSLSKRHRVPALSALAIVVGFSLAAYYAAPANVLGYRFRYGKENWAGAARFIREQQADAVVVAPGYLHLALERYPLGGARPIPSANDSLPDLQPYRRVAVVISHASAAQERLVNTLAHHYRLLAKMHFPSQNAIEVLIYKPMNRVDREPTLLAESAKEP